MLKYLKDHIMEELDGAIDYMTKAVEYKDHECGAMFKSMAMMELDHANHLVKLFNSMKTGVKETDAERVEMYKAIMDGYTTSMSKLESLKKLYWAI